MRRPPTIVFIVCIASCTAQPTCKSEPPHHVITADSSVIDGECNVLTQAGCSVGEECTWIIDMADMTSSVGHIGCAPAGTIATGSPCTRNPPGATGYDDCVEGDYCFGPDAGGSGVCKQICDQAGGTPMCDSSHACVTYDGVFGPSGMAVAAGLCEAKCDPLADNNFLGSQGDNRTGTACGSAGSAVGSGFLYAKGCYGFPYPANGPTEFTCSAQYNYSRVHRTACDAVQHPGDLATCGPDASNVYINGCAAGYMPLFSDYEGSSQTDCMAFCSPVSCYNNGTGSAAGSATCGSGSGSNITGLAPHQCKTTNLQYASFNQVDPTASWSAATPVVDNGEQCLYSWIFEIDSTSQMFVQSPTSDTVGFCVDHSQYKYDPAGGSNNTATWPRCDYIGMGSNGYAVAAGQDAAFFGCVDSATARSFGELNFDGKTTIRRTPLRMPYHAIARTSDH